MFLRNIAVSFVGVMIMLAGPLAMKKFHQSWQVGLSLLVVGGIIAFTAASLDLRKQHRKYKQRPESSPNPQD